MKSARPIRLLRKRRAFTIIEMLIAVGAVGLIALGLARLFASTGRTVSKGKTVSVLNEYARLVESQMRTDLQSITRQGFLVIRNRYAQGGGTADGPVLLSENDVSGGRQRRVDELLFFAKGQFTSLREPQHPLKFPKGSAARIYYGHGLSAGPDVFDAQLDDDPGLNTGMGRTWPKQFGEVGPSEFASSWILLRHVAVLAPPQPTTDRAPLLPGGQVITYPPLRSWADNSVQTGLQPAAASLFRSVAWNISPPSSPISRSLDALRKPMFASGIVDVVSADLTSIRADVLDAPNRGINLLGTSSVPGATDPISNGSVFGPSFAASPTAATCAKRLMADALPGYDEVLLSGTNANMIGDASRPERRMRCEPSPPDFTGRLQGLDFGTFEPYRRQDQLLLSGSNFVPGCTEFIVEWSFGDLYVDNATNRAANRVGRVIWHGMERYEDLNFDGAPTPDQSSTGSASDLVAEPFRGQGSTGTGNGDELLGPLVVLSNGAQLSWVYSTELFHAPVNIGGNSPVARTPGSPVHSFFGFIDPTFPPALGGGLSVVSPAAIPWPWPRLLRVTFSLVDPNDAGFEQSYQFIFEIPQNSEQQF